jgi:hypothetical protein
VKPQFDESVVWDKVYSSLSEYQIITINNIKENTKKYEDMA